MKRREFIAGLGSAAATWPLAARAQRRAVPVIGFLGSESPDQLFAVRLGAFHQGLSESGFVEGRNVVIEYRWANGQYNRLPGLAADLVRHQVDVIVAMSAAPAVLAAKTATAIIPIVFLSGIDPVEAGLVASLSRPGGNLTGVALLDVELGPKRLELLHEVVPTATSIGVLVNPANAIVTERFSKDIEAAAHRLGLQVHLLRASNDGEIDEAFAKLSQLRVGALMIGPFGYFMSRNEQLSALSLRHAIPTIFESREFAAAGGLMSYGGRGTDGSRIAGSYAGRILKGEKPADLPVQQATKVELILNLKTAKMLGITVPLPLLGRADEVIE
jgi:putative ABC transport system substrate-binding protein